MANVLAVKSLERAFAVLTVPHFRGRQGSKTSTCPTTSKRPLTTPVLVAFA
jgi:hypothetical protein